MARLENPHAPRLLEADAPRQSARVKRRERRPETKPPRHGDIEPSHSLLDVLADYVIEGAPTRTGEPIVEPETVTVAWPELSWKTPPGPGTSVPVSVFVKVAVPVQS
jgi:hypothetical protein